MTSPQASSMPSGANGLGTNQTPGGGTIVSGPGTWLPPFRLGQGLTGVFTDPIGLIAGEPATATTAALGAVSSSSAGGDSSGDSSGGDGSGPSGGAASSMPSGGASGPYSVPGQAGGAGPAPKASSQAQRNANNAEAEREFPGYQGVG